MNRFIGNDGSIDAKISRAIEDTYRLTVSTSRAYYGKGVLWESSFSGTGAKPDDGTEKGTADDTHYMVCGTCRWGGSHLVK